MDKDTRKAIERATQGARKLLEDDFAAQLEADFDIHLDGSVAAGPGSHLSVRQACQRDSIVAAVIHKRRAGEEAAAAVQGYLRDAAFTTLNRFVALKMLEGRGLVLECISKGEQSTGYREFSGMAPGILLLPNSEGYRLYIESIFDELSTEVKVLFDRRDPSSILWPRRATFDRLLALLNAAELSQIWAEDETIGWVYQYFNDPSERRKMRDESQAPRSSRELAVRNQFFTPKYVVQFLTDNTLGRIWSESRGNRTKLAEKCAYLVRKPNEDLSSRFLKDPRDLRVLDPACGSGHFLLYAFDLLLTIYEEAYADPDSPKSKSTGRTLAEDYSSLDDLKRALPALILAHNLHGVDIDSRCAQIAQLALWLRAQTAYRDFGIPRSERTQIRRSNIVVAEPLVVDKQVIEKFVTELGDDELERIFTSLADSFSLAGELGLLLRVEKLVEATRFGWELFAPSEKRIRATLDIFARESALRSDRTQRWLFAEDASQAFGLLAIAEKRFDVVLMNPPFGNPPEQVADLLEKRDCGNLYTAFVRRALELSGCVGCISDRTFLTQASFKSFRRELLHVDSGLRQLADLGWGVLDANVQTVAYIIERGAVDTLCLNCKDDNGKEALLRKQEAWSVVEHSSFLSLPDSVIAFELPGAMLQRVSEWRSLKSIANLPRGLGSNKAARTYLAWFEVPLAQNAPRRWEPLANGGDFSPWWRDDLGVADWRTPKGSLWVDLGDSDSSRLYDQGPSPDYFKPGLSFPKQSAMFNVAVLPTGFLPTREGKAIIPHSDADRWWLLSYLNSGPIRAFIRDTCGLHKQSGAVGRIPVPPDGEWNTTLSQVSQDIVRRLLISRQLDETSPYFVSPLCARAASIDEAAVLEQLHAVETVVRQVIGLRDLDEVWPEPPVVPPSFQPSEFAVTSWLVGVAFGRFDVRLATGQRAMPPEPEPFDPVPSRAPGMYPAGEEPSDSPDILVDDRGHSADLIARVRAAAELVKVVLPDMLREWFAKEFFSLHIKLYSKSRRKAPIYWQLSTPSAKYSVWLYIQAFNKDTLFRIQKDYLEPKLAHEDRQLKSLTDELGKEPGAMERKKLAAQAEFVQELRILLEEIRMVAPLWSPDLNDGVMINFAPLWRVTPQNALWQKELKSTWDGLCQGKYDWAQLAMHLWPERVVTKCTKDRSLAIAHGLEEVFWVKGDKGKWNARSTPAREIDERVRERTSPAVKAALRALLDAPPVAGGAARGGRKKAFTKGGT